mgnify:CR=1 FL=1
MKNPTLLLSADLHIRSDVPENRIDDFLQEQERKIGFILDLSNKYKCPIVVAGDIGDKPKWENWLLEKYIKKFKSHRQKIYVLPGQHDLPNHRLDKLKESGLGVLVASKAIFSIDNLFIQNPEVGLIYEFPFGKKINHSVADTYPSNNIAFIHQLISQSKLWEGQENFTSAKSLLKKFPEYGLIVSGDNHQSFVEEYKGRLLVNPGSIMRSTIAQFSHKPKIYLWKAEKNEIEEIEIPIKPSKEVFNLLSINKQGKRDERMSAFVESLKSDCEFKMSFKDNLNKFLIENKIEQKIKDKIFMSLEKEN